MRIPPVWLVLALGAGAALAGCDSRNAMSNPAMAYQVKLQADAQAASQRNAEAADDVQYAPTRIAGQFASSAPGSDADNDGVAILSTDSAPAPAATTSTPTTDSSTGN